jgi:phosphatidylglycerophosphate synthase
VLRSWISWLPALACFAWFLGGVPVYWLHARRAAARSEPAIEVRRPSLLIPKWLIYYLLWLIAPVENLLIRRRVAPNTLSTAGLVLSLAAAVALGFGWFDGGGWLYLFVGILDLFDGRVARATGRASKAGAVYDSVLDRYAEAAVFAGLMVYYRGTWIAGASLCALWGSLMVSHVRATAERLGLAEEAQTGSLPRPERVFLLGVSLAAAPFVAARFEHGAPPRYYVAAAAICWLMLMSHWTATRRALAAYRAFKERPIDPPP